MKTNNILKIIVRLIIIKIFLLFKNLRISHNLLFWHEL